MTEKEYRAHPAISRSELFKISESPEKFKYYREHPEEPTPALLFGQLFHAMALQPETVWDEFIIAPDVDRHTKAGKEAYAEFEAQAQGKAIVTSDMAQQAYEMCEALHNNEFVKKLFKGEKEKAFFWKDDLTGEPCKCRTDILLPLILTDLETGERYPSIHIIDIKTTENAETDAFIKSSIKYGYDFQSAMYIEGVKMNYPKTQMVDGVEKNIHFKFVFIVIEKKPPYAINILQADKLFLLRGYDLFREYIGTYHYCRESGNWFGYLGRRNLINTLGLPSYLAKEIE